MRPAIGALALTALLAAGLHSSAAGPGPGGSWTQKDNPYTLEGGNTGYSKNCNPCLRWPSGPDGYYTGTYTNLTWSDTSVWGRDVNTAVRDASALPDNSPSFSEVGGSSCNGVDLCIEGASISDTTICASTFTNYNSDGIILSAVIELNSNDQFSDGPSNQYCDLRAVMHHEMGHVLGLGHSAVKSDLMWYAPTNEAFGQDEQNGLRAIYGAGGTSGSGCPNCQCLPPPQAQAAPPAAQIQPVGPCGQGGGINLTPISAGQASEKAHQAITSVEGQGIPDPLNHTQP